MTEQEIHAILAIAFIAANADGGTSESEREQVKQAAGQLTGSGIDLAAAWQDVLLGRIDLAGAVAPLGSPAARQAAYDAALGVCHADGVTSAAEQAFLVDLAARLGLDAARSGEQLAQATTLAAAAVPGVTSAAAATPPAGARQSKLTDAELDKLIVDAAILNGALELLPESLATMAIIPLQMRLVYRIGESWGYELDHGHIKDFLATFGVGLASQYLEQFGRKLLGGLLGGLGRQAASSGMSFASTWALGQVARRYYAGGRSFSTQMLRDSFQQMLGQGREVQGKFLPQIREQAGALDPGRIMDLIRGQ